jgi:hypothetical protein
MKYGQEKSDLFIVAMRPANKTWVTSSGVGGAKEEDQREHSRAIHAPDTEPGKRVPGARMCARSCPWASSLVTQGGSPVRESRSPGSVRGVLSNGHPYRDRPEITRGMGVISSRLN